VVIFLTIESGCEVSIPVDFFIKSILIPNHNPFSPPPPLLDILHEMALIYCWMANLRVCYYVMIFWPAQTGFISSSSQALPSA